MFLSEKTKSRLRKLASRFLCISLALVELFAASVPAGAITFSNNALNNVQWEAYNSADAANTKIYSGANS